MGYGNYVIKFKADKSEFSDWDKQKEKIIILKASSEDEARNLAEKQIKEMGYVSMVILDIQANNNTSRNVKKNEESLPQIFVKKKKSDLLISILVAFGVSAIIVFLLLI